MNKNVDKLLELSNDKGRYQYCILAIAFGFWITLDLISISLPYLEKTSLVRIWDQSNKQFKNFSMDYTTCETILKKQSLNNSPSIKETKSILNNSILIIERSQHSWVIEYGIECDKIKTGLIGSVAFFGVLIGSIALQFIPDSIGRRNTVLLGSSLFSLILVSFNFVSDYYYTLFLCFFLQIFAYLGLLTVFMLSNEITSPNVRSVFGAIINSAFSFCGITFILMYKYLNDWRLCFTIASLFNLLIALLFYTIAHESPRYYNTKGEYKKMIKVLTSIARFNDNGDGKTINDLKNELNKVNNYDENRLNDENNNNVGLTLISSDKINVLDKDEESTLKAKQTLVDNVVYGVSKNLGYFTLFTHPSLRKTFLINCYLWFSTSGIYYGLSIYLKNLPGDLYYNGIFIYFSEIFSYVLSGWIINLPQLGRKGSMILFESISLLGYILLLILNIENYYKTILSFVARFSISGVYNILYTYSTEVYPTVVRANGFGFNSVSARLGGIIFPLMIELLEEKVVPIFTLLNFIALLFILLLPETYGKPLQDDIDE
jgi:MFS family permease